MGVLQVLYGILLVGSLAFGLEALLIGLGGRVTAMYRRDRWELFRLALPTGLGIVVLSILTSAALAPEPIYLCALVLVFTFIVGGVISLSKERFFKPRALPARAPGSEREIESMLEGRGFGRLVKKGKKSRKRR